MEVLRGTDALDFFKSKMGAFVQNEDCVLYDGRNLFIYQEGNTYFHKWYLGPCRDHYFFRKINDEDADFIHDEDLQVLTKDTVYGFYSYQGEKVIINGRTHSFSVELDSYDFHPETDIEELERQYTIRNMAVMKVMCPILERHLGFEDAGINRVRESDLEEYIENNRGLF